jgi:hypothetical protein
VSFAYPTPRLQELRRKHIASESVRIAQTSIWWRSVSAVVNVCHVKYKYPRGTGRGAQISGRFLGCRPRRGSLSEISKFNPKSPMHKKCSKYFSRPRFGGRAAMHTEMAPTSSRAQGKGDPNVAASAAKCVIGTGHPAIYRRYRGDCGHEWTCSLGQLGRV